MNFEDAEIDNSCSPAGKGRILGVIVLTDNRQSKSVEKASMPDFRCSAFKCILFTIKKLRSIPCNLPLKFQTTRKKRT